MFCKNNDGVYEVFKEVFQRESIESNINAVTHALLKKTIAELHT